MSPYFAEDRMFKGKEISLKVVDVRCRIVTLKFKEGKKKRNFDIFGKSSCGFA